jgi:beta-phosphoglucomutase
LGDETKKQLTEQKNFWYVEYISCLDANEILPGVTDYILKIRAQGIKTAIGSASKNTRLILDRLGIIPLFDAIIDGNSVGKAKPDPEVFLAAAQELGIPPTSCVVFEDAEAGIEAALRAGMGAVGI